MNETLDNTSKSIATTNKTIGLTLTLAEFAYNNTPSATTAYTLLANKGYSSRTSRSSRAWSASIRAHNFITDLDSYISNFGNT